MRTAEDRLLVKLVERSHFQQVTSHNWLGFEIFEVGQRAGFRKRRESVARNTACYRTGEKSTKRRRNRLAIVAPAHRLALAYATIQMSHVRLAMTSQKKQIEKNAAKTAVALPDAYA